MTHPRKHLGSQTSQIKRQGPETCCAREQIRVNVYCRRSSKSRCFSVGSATVDRISGRTGQARGARPLFANESAACLQITRWEGSGSDFSKTLDLIFSPPVPDSTLTCQTSSSLPSGFWRRKKKKKKSLLSLITVRKHKRQFLSSCSNPRLMAPPFLSLADTLLGAQCCFVR